MGFKKEFKHKYGKKNYKLIKFYWDVWIKWQYIPNDWMDNDIKIYYIDNKIPLRTQLSLTRLDKALAEYALRHNIIFESNIIYRGYRAKHFKKQDL